MLKIGNLSEQTGVSTEAIRYYERIGLIPEPQRADNGYRVYTQSDVERLSLGVFAYYLVEITDYNKLKWQFNKEIRLPAKRRRYKNGGS